MVTVANRIQLSYPVVKSDNMTILLNIFMVLQCNSSLLHCRASVSSRLPNVSIAIFIHFHSRNRLPNIAKLTKTNVVN